MILIAFVLVLLILVVVFSKKKKVELIEYSQLEGERKAKSRHFKIAGISYRCTKNDIGVIMGKVAYDPENAHDSNAIAIIANAGQKNEKLLGYISREDQVVFRNFAYKEQELAFVGFIEEFDSGGKKALFGKIKAYYGTDEDVEADMSADMKYLAYAFSEKKYVKRMDMLEIW